MITDRITVKPTWKEYEPKDGELIIEIDPGMAFGTGTHATTSLCVAMLEKYIKGGESVLDVGTGSGILLIAAAKLGASKIVGVDIDEVAVEVAKENIKLNDISEEKYRVFKGNLVDDLKEEKFEVVVSNILAEVIVTLVDDIKNVLTDNGLFITSGIIKEKAEMVAKKMAESGFEIVDNLEKEEWVSIVGRLK
jgi:ribosomal protein L11 methyltransferase